MNDEEMKRFPEELGKLGFVFNFITYGGHQIDGLAAEEFATALKQDGMLCLARLQRKFRLLESPYRTPQTLVGGPRLDAALMAGLSFGSSNIFFTLSALRLMLRGTVSSSFILDSTSTHCLMTASTFDILSPY